MKYGVSGLLVLLVLLGFSINHDLKKEQRRLHALNHAFFVEHVVPAFECQVNARLRQHIRSPVRRADDWLSELARLVRQNTLLTELFTARHTTAPSADAVAGQWDGLIRTLFYARPSAAFRQQAIDFLVNPGKPHIPLREQFFDAEPDAALRVEGILSAEGSHSAEGTHSAEGSLLAEGSSPAEGSLAAEGSYFAEGSAFATGTLSAEGFFPAEGSCAFSPIDKVQLWAQIQKNMAQVKIELTEKVSAPMPFLNTLWRLKKEPLMLSLIKPRPDYRAELTLLLQWADEIRRMTADGLNQVPRCHQIQQGLSELQPALSQEGQRYTEVFEVQCLLWQRAQLAQDNRVWGDDLAVEYEIGAHVQDNRVWGEDLYLMYDEEISFSPSMKRLMSELTDLQQLSFLVGDTNPPAAGHDQVDMGDVSFLWDIEQLEAGFQFMKDYENFSLEHGWLPHLGGGVDAIDGSVNALALNQLQIALDDTMARAKHKVTAETLSDQPNTVLQQQERSLAYHINNFGDASTVLIAMINQYKTLHLPDDHQLLASLTEQQALHLLEQLDKLFNVSRLYKTPLPKEKWLAPGGSTLPFAQVYFGLSDSAQLKSYLHSQSARLQVMALNYAEPLVEYLMQVNSPYVATPLAARWKNTVIALHQANNLEPGNALRQLEDFIAGPLDQVNSENCSSQVELLKRLSKRASPGEDIFTDKLNQLVNHALQFCSRRAAS